jgi:3-hydroxyisobutyrate dehydrogenase-like beta-hydroxyacid dehydrogenase
MKIAFLGLGGMGTPMARNLLLAGYELTVFNRTAARAAPLRAEGAHVAASPPEAVRDADVVITMLADDQAVRDTILSRTREWMKPGAVHMCTSTISVELSKELAKAHAAAGQSYVGSPVLGRPDAAEAQKLWIMAAGPAAALEKCRPLMQAIGRGITVIGDEGWQAHLVKIGANFLIGSMLEALGEALALIRKAGIPPALFLEAANGVFNSPVYANYGKLVAEQKFEPAGFKLKLGMKDINLALAAGAGLGVPLPLAELVHDHYLEAMAHGEADLDWSAVARVPARHAGVSGGGRS